MRYRKLVPNTQPPVIGASWCPSVHLLPNLVLLLPGFRNVRNMKRLVRLHQYHDAHTVHKALAKLQPVEEKAFLTEYHAQVSRNHPKAQLTPTNKERSADGTGRRRTNSLFLVSVRIIYRRV